MTAASRLSGIQVRYEPNSCQRKLRRARAPEQHPRDLLPIGDVVEKAPFPHLVPHFLHADLPVWEELPFGGFAAALKPQPPIHTKRE